MKKILMAAAVATTLGFASNGFAQDCTGTGSLTTSQACDTDITLTIASQVVVSGLLGTVDMSADFDAVNGTTTTVPFCIGNNSGGVDVSATSGNGASGTYSLDDAGTTLDYTVNINSSAITADAAATSVTAQLDTLATCLGGTAGTATMVLFTSAADQSTAGAGTFTDTLTVTIAAQ